MGSITSRDVCSMCGGGPVGCCVVCDHERFVPLPRLRKFKTTISSVLKLCDKCLMEDAEIENRERERTGKKARQ